MLDPRAMREAEREWLSLHNVTLSRDIAHLLTPYKKACRAAGVSERVRVAGLGGEAGRRSSVS